MSEIQKNNEYKNFFDEIVKILSQSIPTSENQGFLATFNNNYDIMYVAFNRYNQIVDLTKTTILKINENWKRREINEKNCSNCNWMTKKGCVFITGACNNFSKWEARE